MSVRLVVTVTSNLLPQVARRLPKQAEAAVKATLDAGKETVVGGMQASPSPSAPGEMPGIDTGALVGSIATQQAVNTTFGEVGEVIRQNNQLQERTTAALDRNSDLLERLAPPRRQTWGEGEGHWS